MKFCDVVKACIWNEVAITLAHAITEIDSKANGKHLVLELKMPYTVHLIETPYEWEESYSDRCYIEHAPSRPFVENPVLA